MSNRSTDLATILADLGVEIKRVSGDEVNGRCPVHHLTKGRASNRYSWYMNTDSGLHHCFTCGARGTLPMLVSQLSGDPDSIVAVQKVLIRNGVTRLTAPQEDEPAVEVDWIRYSQFRPLPEPILELRQLHAETAHRYGIRWGEVRYGEQDVKMIIAPIVSPMGELRGWQGKKTGIVMNVPEGVNKSLTLFGIERAASDTALLLESPLDVVRAAHAGAGLGISPLASFGANVSAEQIRLITSRFDRVIIAMDNDPAGKAESKRLSTLLGDRGGIRHKSFLNYAKHAPDFKDIGDMPDSLIRTVLSDPSKYAS